jgi:hypothetical protein
VEATGEARAEDEENRIRAERELEEVSQGVNGIMIQDDLGEGEVEEDDEDEDEGEAANMEKMEEMDVDESVEEKKAAEWTASLAFRGV